MKSELTMLEIEKLLQKSKDIEFQIKVLYDILEKIFDKGIIKARASKHKLMKYISSKNLNEKLYALNVIVSDGKGLLDIPTNENLEKCYLETRELIIEEISRRYIQSKIEGEVEKLLNEKQTQHILL